MKVTILYSELAEYTIACLKALKTKEVTLQLVHWPINSEAPFQFDLSFLDEVYSRERLSDAQLLEKVESFSPQLVLASGWMDKGYVATCKSLKQNGVTTVLSMDNHWNGSLKQQIASFISPFTIQKTFSKAFVPGQVQKNYALKLGFKEKDIQTGFYSADTTKFDVYYQQINPSKKQQFPKRFLFLGRYVKHKGIFDMWNAFVEFRKDFPDWELWCVGTGDEYENRIEADGIKHFGFKQPSELLPILQNTGVYILPSHFEPWGVSVHEMAVAGFPMILSNEIGSKEAFLVPENNGYIFESGNESRLLEAMKKMALKTDDQLFKMAEKSRTLGLQNTPELWAQKLLSFTSAP